MSAGGGTGPERLPVVVAGGGPGGMMLALLLARAGIPVTLLETHADFDRDFRGDSLHPYTLELLDALGLADALLSLPHFRAERFRFHLPGATVTTADYRRVPSRYNYVALMPQARFLAFLAERAAAYPDFTLATSTRASGLTEEDGRVTGVRVRDRRGERTLPARLVVAADGRFSRLRRLSGIPVRDLGASSDLLWFRLPRTADDPPDADVDLYFDRDHYLALLGGDDSWQVGYTLPKGGFAAARDAGVEPIRATVARRIPWLAERAALLRDFGQTTLLSVEISRMSRWHREGLLFLGDAAHVISPVGGNGILMAVQDAVAAANRLVPALREPGRTVPEPVLAGVQAEREPAIEQVQARQVRVEQRVAQARDAGKPLLPRVVRWISAVPRVQARAARANAYGPLPPVLDPSLAGGC